MKRVEVLIPFHMIATNTDHKAGDIIEVSDAQLAKIKALNINMVSVLADVAETAEAEPEKKQRKPRKPKQ